METLSPAASSRGPRKRLRVNEACTPCRDRKTRCDARHPVCRACENRGVGHNCSYDTPRASQRRRFHQAEPVPSQSAPNTTYGSPPMPVARLDTADKPHGHHNEPSPGQPWSSTQSDGLATFVGREDSSVYGPSSTIVFVQHVLSDEASCETGLPPPTPDSHYDKVHIPERMPEPNDGMAVLPRRHSADDFIACFWDFIHPMFPVLHKPTFTARYERFWVLESSGQVSQLSQHAADENNIFLSTLNLVLALGCKFSNLIPDKQKSSVGDDFYKKSRQLFIFDALDSASLPLVQLLVLNGVYLQSTPYANRCWNAIGLAIRVAQSLGLHLEARVSQNSSQVEREMMRRVWHSCVNLDRLLAMTFGRPTMVQRPNSLALPAMVDDEYLSDTGPPGKQPSGMPSRFGLFVSSCTLLELLEEVLASLSRHEPVTKNMQSKGEAKIQQGEILTCILSLNRRLNEFASTIPAYLKLSDKEITPTSSVNHVALQQHVLHCRFLLTRLLLLRPLLLSTIIGEKISPIDALDSIGQPLLDHAVIQQCCELCLQTAYGLVDTLYWNLGTLYRTSGWHTVYFTFSATIVLLASLKCELLDLQPGDKAFRTCWSRSLSILKHYEHQVHSASHAIHSLTEIRRRVFQTTGSALNPKVGELSPTPPVDNNLVALFDAHSFDISSSGDASSTCDPITENFLATDLMHAEWLDFFT
ncbi:unnamed protein product [Clonostachys rhizophaga]|uniref:Zn(2)-C6 fungal-type domain-containing protein n=1 Tax=Clonostachys rhizophaga TaxID=160324 RepID=A0A9N9VPU8_9HYPO|nr:unnamed protein product [Clonostachys rhizophaga]